MKIVFLNEHFGMGGLERVTTTLGNELNNEESYEIFYYSLILNKNFYKVDNNFYLSNYVKKNENKWLQPEKYLEKMEYLLTGKIKPSKYIRKNLNEFAAWCNKKQIDCIVVSGPLLISCVPELKKLLNIKIISWLHNTYETYTENYAVKYIEQFKNGLSCSDMSVCLTESDLSKYSLLTKKIVQIYNPLTIETNQLSDLTTKNISFTGRIDYDHKGIDTLVAVAEIIPEDWTITIAGSGNKNQITRLKKDILHKNLQKKLIYSGPLDGEKLKEHYINSSIYLMTSNWEGFGLVLIEAMAFGLPTVALGQNGSNEILDYGKYGLVVENNNNKIINLKNNIEFLTSSYDNRKYWSEKSFERVIDFDISNIVKKWGSLIVETVNGGTDY